MPADTADGALARSLLPAASDAGTITQPCCCATLHAQLTSRSCALLLTWSATTSLSSALKSNLAVAALEGMNLSLYLTLDLGENQLGLPKPLAAADPAAAPLLLLPAPVPFMGEPTGVRGSPPTAAAPEGPATSPAEKLLKDSCECCCCCR
jgi:hypothetical protein